MPTSLRLAVAGLLFSLAAACSTTSATSQDSSPGDTATQDTTTQDTATQDTATQDTAAQDTAAQDTGASDTTTTDTGVDSDAVPPPLRQDLTLTTSDGKSIAATAHRVATTQVGAPGVVLIHQFNQNRAQWDPYIDDLTRRGLHVLTIDLRGHGQSDAQDGAFAGILSDPNGAPNDVKAAIAWLKDDAKADPARLAIIGTSIGANLACVAAANGYGVKLSIAVSARDTAVASLADKADGALTFSGLFILAAESDGGGAQAATATSFHDRGSEPRKKMVLSGGDHGKALIANHSEVWPAILGWLDAEL